MKTFKFISVFICLIVLSGCGSSAVITQPLAPEIVANLGEMKYHVVSVETQLTEVPNGITLSIKGYLMDELSKRSLLAFDNIHKTHDVKVVITDYNMRSGASRILFGAMAGSDGIRTQVTVIDANTGVIIGQSDVSSYNASAVGGESDVARMLAEEIGKFLAGETDVRVANRKKKSQRK